ncbi:site-2 protease family protein [soil metagenome]
MVLTQCFSLGPRYFTFSTEAESGLEYTAYMFKNAIRLPFRLLGIPISLDRSFLVVLPLFAWLIGSQVPNYLAALGGAADPRLSTGAFPYLLGLAAALGLFASVLVHELGHAVAGRMYGVKTKEITLWFFGGVAQFDDLPRQRGAEAVVAIAGPITSVVLAGLFWGLLQTGSFGPAALFVVSYLVYTNFALAIFNLLPALPLDGGRVLRSLLALKLDYLRATTISVRVSQVAAVLLGLFGLYSRNFFLAAIALFIFNASRNEARYAVVTRALDPLKVRDLMHREVTTIEPEMRLESFTQLLAFKRQPSFPVVDRDGTLLGQVTRHAAEGRPGDLEVGSVVSPAETIFEDEDALQALKRMAGNSLGQLIVTDAVGRLVGTLSAADLAQRLQDPTQRPAPVNA